MNKAEKGKVKKAATVVKVETNKTGKERFHWSTWDSIHFDLLSAVHDAGLESRKSKKSFEDILRIKLACNADLVTKVRANHKLADGIINSLPCGHRTCYDFIREVSQNSQ